MNLDEITNAATNGSFSDSGQGMNGNYGAKSAVSSENVGYLDEMVFGDAVELDSEPGVYDPNKDMERMTKGITESELSKSKLPESIKRSLISNQLNYEYKDNSMDEIEAKLSGSLESIKRSMGITQKIEEKEAQKKAEKRSEQLNEDSGSYNQGVDYNMITNIVENAIERKLNQLTEAKKSDNISNVSVMKIGQKFLFLDEDENVYECVMKYKGKNKRRKK